MDSATWRLISEIDELSSSAADATVCTLVEACSDAAATGGEALKRIPAHRPGLIVSDWNMEPKTGLQLLQAVRANKDIADIPFIMVTAESKSDCVIAAKKAGVNNYIVKPFNAETLKGKMAAVHYFGSSIFVMSRISST